MSSLVLRDLTLERGGRAVVRDVSLEIAAGQVTALLGPNGAGKSTLVLAVGGVLRPRTGAVLLDGTDIAGRRPERIAEMICSSVQAPIPVWRSGVMLVEYTVPNGPS